MVVILIYHTSYSLVGIPYDASMAEMAPETHDRLKLSYWKSVFGIIGVLIGTLVAAPLFESVGAVVMGAVVGGVGMVTIYTALFGLRETNRPVGETMSIVEGFKATFKNKQFLILFFSTLAVHVAYQMLLANFPYFVTLVLKQSESDVGHLPGHPDCVYRDHRSDLAVVEQKIQPARAAQRYHPVIGNRNCIGLFDRCFRREHDFHSGVHFCCSPGQRTWRVLDLDLCHDGECRGLR